MSRVLLLRESAPDWHLQLQKRNFQPHFLPVLYFRSVGEVELIQRLRGELAGLVLSSPRAAEAVASAGLLNWGDKPIFVVGAATSAIITERLQLPTRGSEAGNADNLSDYIISQRNTFDSDKPLLFPCGNLRKDTLPHKLQDAGILLDCITVYTTSTKETLDSELAQLQDDAGIPDVIVFFSPSGVDSVVPILNKIGYDFEHSHLIAIGPSTEKQIKKWNHLPSGTAAQPTVEGVIEILENITNH